MTTIFGHVVVMDFKNIVNNFGGAIFDANIIRRKYLMIR